MVLNQYKKNNIFLIVVAVISVFELAIFFHFPLLSSIRKEFQVSESSIQLSAVFNVCGIGISSLIYGGLSDSYGRKRIFLFGILCFTISSYSLSFINSIHALLYLRLIQGVGAGISYSISNAILSDIYKGIEFKKAIMTMNVIIGMVIMLSPVFGGYISNVMGWRYSFKLISCFGFLLFIYSVFFLPETLQSKKIIIDWRDILKNYLELLKNKHYLRFLIIKVLVVSIAFVNITNLPLLFIETYNISLTTCGFVMSLGSFIFVIGGLVCNTLVRYFNVNSIIKYSLCLVLSSSVMLIIVEFLSALTPLSIQLIKIPYLLGIACIFTNATKEIIGAVSTLSGSASAIMIALEMFVSSIAIKLVSIFYNGTIYPIEVYAIIMTAISFLFLMQESSKDNDLIF